MAGAGQNDLPARIAAHDPEAIMELFDRWAPLLRGMIRRLISSPDEAEIALENVFLRLWTDEAASLQTSKEHSGASAEGWLFIASRREAGELRRKSSGRQALRIPPDRATRWLPEAHEIRRLTSRLDLMARAVAQLPASQKKILDLVLYEGLTEIEVAEALSEPPGKVRDHVRAAFAFVRQRVRTLTGTWTAGI